VAERPAASDEVSHDVSQMNVPLESRLPGASGLLGAVRGFADGVVGSIHDRLQLLALELNEEKFRLIQTFIWISAILFLAVIAVLFTSLVVVVVFWETARVAVVSILAGVYVAATIAAIMGFRRFLKRQPKPFAATLRELQQDRECIRPES
jgi:uncharacterized membrane protein YqjE